MQWLFEGRWCSRYGGGGRYGSVVCGVVGRRRRSSSSVGWRVSLHMAKTIWREDGSGGLDSLALHVANIIWRENDDSTHRAYTGEDDRRPSLHVALGGLVGKDFAAMNNISRFSCSYLHLLMTMTFRSMR